MVEMNLYHLSQSEEVSFDTFSACVVAAETEDAARRIHPWLEFAPNDALGVDSEGNFYRRQPDGRRTDAPRCWCRNIADVAVGLLGVAVDGTKEGVILGSFHAG